MNNTTQTIAKINKIFNVKVTCELCGFATARIRYTRLKSDSGNEVVRGYFGSRALGIDERYALREGEHAVCADRRGCQYRQNKKRFVRNP